MRTLPRCSPPRLVVALAVSLGATLGAGLPAHANTDPVSDMLTAPGATPGTAGIGALMRAERSAYRGGGTTYDLLPVYLYEGERVFLHASRGGIKLSSSSTERIDLFLDHRFEGIPTDGAPAALAGLGPRNEGIDLGISWRWHQPWGTVQTEFLHDVSSASNGNELRLGYSYDWRSGRLALRPSVTVAWRDAKLNDYYYGVRPGEASAARPGYQPGSGVNTSLALYGSYDLTDHWRLLGGISATWMDSRVRDSPIVDSRVQPAVFIGAAYDFGSFRKPWAAERSPTYVKLLHGSVSDDACTLVRIMTLRCTSTSDSISSSFTAVQVGKPFIERLNGWPVDLVGYVSLGWRNDGGTQPNGWQLDVYMKAYYDGFPWSDRVRTRLGFGTGLSLAQHVPYTEVESQARRDRPTSRLLNYLDPSIDFSLGDAIGSRALKDTFIGVGVSHRSGIFGSSRLLGNVNGGSNYLYTYVESIF